MENRCKTLLWGTRAHLATKVLCLVTTGWRKDATPAEVEDIGRQAKQAFGLVDTLETIWDQAFKGQLRQKKM
eukprot:3344780-Amphidinium_carterae.1